MLVLERTAGSTETGEQAPERGPQVSWTRPVLAMAAGLALVGAALAIVQQASPAGVRPPSTTLTLAGPADVTVQPATYEPGQSSGWHAHTGMHAVLVLSGAVTFYDGQCRGRTFGPGESYVGGQVVHVARNETDAPAAMSITYLFPAGQSHTTFHVDVPAPAGCDVR
jgi:quercetin dioxygenase-like cupin family protein